MGSFLDQLQAKKRTLKTSASISVTYQDGRRFRETPEGVRLSPAPSASPGFVIDTKPDNVPAPITPHLYLGSQDCCDLSVLTQHGITAVLSVGVPAPVRYERVRYETVPCLDLPDVDFKPVVRKCVEFLRACADDSVKVLVHCNAGVSRSPSVAIGFLMVECGMGFEAAYAAVKSARPCVRPNDGFLRQLKLLTSS